MIQVCLGAEFSPNLIYQMYNSSHMNFTRTKKMAAQKLSSEELKKKVTKFSDIVTIDGNHTEGYLCSKKTLWDKDGLTNIAKYGLPLQFRVIDSLYNFSASAIFTKNQLENACRKIKMENINVKKIYIVDLLREYHGLIDYGQNALPFAFRGLHNVVNSGVAYNEVEKYEASVLLPTMNDKFIRKIPSFTLASKFTTIEGQVENVYQVVEVKNNAEHINFLTEKEVVQRIKINDCDLSYKRLPCKDYRALAGEAVLELASFFQNEFNPHTDWIHVHCQGGKGRATSASVILDMFMRLSNETLHETPFAKLLHFQAQQGGKNLELNGNIVQWKTELSIARYKFLNDIYNFLLKVEGAGLKDVFSVALAIYFAKDQPSQHTIEQAIAASGKVTRALICADESMKTKLLQLDYNKSCTYDAAAIEDENEGCDLAPQEEQTIENYITI